MDGGVGWWCISVRFPVFLPFLLLVSTLLSSLLLSTLPSRPSLSLSTCLCFFSSLPFPFATQCWSLFPSPFPFSTDISVSRVSPLPLPFLLSFLSCRFSDRLSLHSTYSVGCVSYRIAGAKSRSRLHGAPFLRSISSYRENQTRKLRTIADLNFLPTWLAVVFGLFTVFLFRENRPCPASKTTLTLGSRRRSWAGLALLVSLIDLLLAELVPRVEYLVIASSLTLHEPGNSRKGQILYTCVAVYGCEEGGAE